MPGRTGSWPRIGEGRPVSGVAGDGGEESGVVMAGVLLFLALAGLVDADAGGAGELGPGEVVECGGDEGLGFLVGQSGS